MNINKIKDFIELYDDSEINKLKSERKAYDSYVNQKTYYYAYKKITYNTALLFKKLDIKNPFAISILYEYMLWNGFFSKDMKYQYNGAGLIKNPGLFGADIMKGKGVCLNNASMLSDVLNASSYESYLCGCNLPDGCNINHPDIKRDFVSSSVLDKITNELINLISKNRINHTITLINYDGYWFLSDPTNLCFLDINHFLEANICGDNKKISLDPSAILLTSNVSKKHFKDICMQSFQSGNYAKLNSVALLEYYKKIIKLAKNNKDVLYNFHDDNYKYISSVARTLKK